MRPDLIPLPPHVLGKLPAQLRDTFGREYERLRDAMAELDRAVERMNRIVTESVAIADQIDTFAKEASHASIDPVH